MKASKKVPQTYYAGLRYVKEILFEKNFKVESVTIGGTRTLLATSPIGRLSKFLVCTTKMNGGKLAYVGEGIIWLIRRTRVKSERNLYYIFIQYLEINSPKKRVFIVPSKKVKLFLDRSQKNWQTKSKYKVEPNFMKFFLGTNDPKYKYEIKVLYQEDYEDNWEQNL